MITEQQRLSLLRTLSYTLIEPDEIIKQMKSRFGKDISEQEIREHINKLRSVRGR